MTTGSNRPSVQWQCRMGGTCQRPDAGRNESGECLGCGGHQAAPIRWETNHDIEQGPRKINAKSDTVAYVFLHRRPTDKQAWPVIYTDKNLADACKFRVSAVAPVVLPKEVKP